jgi:hypothetical protein
MTGAEGAGGCAIGALPVPGPAGAGVETGGIAVGEVCDPVPGPAGVGGPLPVPGPFGPAVPAPAPGLPVVDRVFTAAPPATPGTNTVAGV